MQEKVVILAIPYQIYSKLSLSLQPGTILVDCSNRSKRCLETQLSQAETLQAPAGVHVVKAFNTVSAYELENGGSVGREVAIAGNNVRAKQVILVELTGFHSLLYWFPFCRLFLPWWSD